MLLLLLLSVPLRAGLMAAEVELRLSTASVSAFQGEKVILSIAIMNNGPTTYRPEEGFFLSYHLLDEHKKQKNAIAYNNQRFIIPQILRRNKTIQCDIPVFFDYPRPGNYTIQWDIVKEGQFWGSTRGWTTAEHKLELKPLVSEVFRNAYMPQFKPSGQELIDHTAFLLRMTLKNCEIRKNNRLFGFAAGSTYPAVWIRDSATLLEYAQLYYAPEDLIGIISLFLETQTPTGEIMDWADISGQTGKNTVASDQESSLVLAAGIIATKQPEWLKQKSGSKTVLSRLEAALEWVWNNRRNKETNLITSGLTADWGDVDNSFPDERARNLSPSSTLTLGIYTQSKYIQAIKTLLELARRATPADSALQNRWSRRLTLVRSNTLKRLWLPDKGYFLIHLVKGPNADKYLALETGILALGGNAEAINAGLMTPENIRRFLQTLEKKRAPLKLRTISFTLLPPYPKGFFPHHLLTHPWSYQNGGEWDWIGGRLVNALHDNGFEREAQLCLQEILRKNLGKYCLHEWEDRTGTGRGALFYAGTAGVLGRALIHSLHTPPGSAKKF